MMQFNEEIEKLLIENDINLEVGKLCLLGIYYNIDYEILYNSSNMVHVAVKKLQMIDIFHYDFDKEEIIWNIPLFAIKAEEKDEDDWGWIKEYQKLFKDVNKLCGSSYRECRIRMEKFFSKHPSVKKEDVMKAAKLYISSVKDPTYLQQANYFITKGAYESRLEQYLELLKDIQVQEKSIKLME